MSSASGQRPGGSVSAALWEVWLPDPVQKREGGRGYRALDTQVTAGVGGWHHS